jgi:hypothetical protein
MGQVFRVVDCQSPRTRYLLPPHSVLLDVLKAIGDPVFDEVGPRVDGQLRYGVLLPFLTAFTLLPSFTVFTSMFSRRLIVGATFGSVILELVGVLDDD